MRLSAWEYSMISLKIDFAGAHAELDDKDGWIGDPRLIATLQQIVAAPAVDHEYHPTATDELAAKIKYWMPTAGIQVAIFPNRPGPEPAPSDPNAVIIC